jgi:hypothetical protein
MSVSELELDLGTATMNCTTAEVAGIFAAMLREMQSVAGRLRPDERVALRLIMSRESGSLTVGEVFHNFARESEAHKTLRRLRAAQFVRPTKSGRWDPDERIDVKPFARLVWDRVGEGTIFAADDSADVVLNVDDVMPTETPMDEPTTEPVAEPEEAPVAEPVTTRSAPAPKPVAASAPPTEPLDVEQMAANIWEEDDVVDLAGDDLQAFAEEEVRGKS